MQRFGWLKASQEELDGLHHDAAHMRDKYGAEAQAMCRFAIAGASDRVLRRRLKRVLHFLEVEGDARPLVQSRRRDRAVGWRTLTAR